MSSAALQLPLENALREFIANQSIDGYPRERIYAAHAKQKINPDTKGTYLGLVADTPDWEQLIVNAVVKVTFEIVSGGMQDHDKAPQNSVDHSERVGEIISLFQDRNFASTLAALNAASLATGIGFSGWEAMKAEPDGESVDGTQLVTKLAYHFEVYLAG